MGRTSSGACAHVHGKDVAEFHAYSMHVVRSGTAAVLGPAGASRLLVEEREREYFKLKFSFSDEI